MLAVSLILLCMCLSQMLVTGQNRICWTCHGSTDPGNPDNEKCLVPKYIETHAESTCYWCSEKMEPVDKGGIIYCEFL
jgi:hypothetical protein